MSLAKIEQHLESHGWTRKVAGDADFDAALLAIEQMAATGKGLIVSGDFIVTWHELHRTGTRLVVTTNLTTAELDARYGGRVLSRLKDLCVPLRLNGGDKRKWTTGGAK